MNSKWFKLEIDHGPGHQSHFKTYRHDENKEKVKEWANEYARRNMRGLPIVRIQEIEKPPKDFLDSEIKACKHMIKHYKKLLTFLKGEKMNIVE